MFSKTQSAFSSSFHQLNEIGAHFFSHSQKLADLVKASVDSKNSNPFKFNETFLAYFKDSVSLMGSAVDQTVESQYQMAYALLDDMAAQNNELLAPMIANSKTLVNTSESVTKSLKSKLATKK